MVYRKSIGAYYTPPELANAMSNWAIRDGTEHILEPSFGGCCFLGSTWQRLKDVGVEKPLTRLYGADIDPSAFNHLHTRFGNRKYKKRFIHGDFLKLNNKDFLRSHFEVVIGNPPFIAHSSLSSEQKRSYRQIAADLGFRISGKPSVWAYFLILSLRYLKVGGRIAWVLPWSFLHSVYGKEVQSHVIHHFQNAKVFAIEEELFLTEGTKERTVILLADSFSHERTKASNLILEYCDSLNDFVAHIKILNEGSLSNTDSKSVDTICQRSEVSQKLHRSVLTKKLVHLNDLMTVSIGVVTGDMKTFTCTVADTKKLNLSQDAYQRCLTKSLHSQGLEFKDSDLDILEFEKKASCLLTIPPRYEFSLQLEEHLSSPWTEEAILNNRTFQKRLPWYSIPKTLIPDAFFRFFAQQGPLFIINTARAQGTNSLYVASFRSTISQQDRDLALASITLSTLSCIGGAHAELDSTRYGNGAIKMSVASVKKIPVLLASDEEKEYTMTCLKAADTLVRENQMEEANKIADKWVKQVSNNPTITEQLSNGVNQLRAMRLGKGRQMTTRNV